MTDMTFDAMEEAAPGPSPVSTGHLPAAERVQAWVEAAYERFKSDDSGRNADHYPALAEVPRDLFGVCVAGTDGAIASAGDIAYPFTIMSVAVPSFMVTHFVTHSGVCQWRISKPSR